MDHIITLRTLIDKYCKSKKFLYVCFIDFEKCFDTIWRNGMLYKLINRGISGKLYEILKDMYSNVIMSVNLSSGVTDSFVTEIGLKQGCVLSPLLFKIFTDDLPSIFDNTCDGCTLYNSDSISCLMYADDLVIISSSKTGLQNGLNKLHSYCQKWKLRVNIKKSNAIIFNKSGKFLKNVKFKYGNENLDTVKEYSYLGIVFTTSGSFSAAIESLCNKSQKAIFTIIKSNYRIISLKSLLKIFDCVIKPILLYGAEVYGCGLVKLDKLYLKTNDTKVFENNKLEKVCNKFYRFILGVHSKASNIGIKGELGRYPVLIDSIASNIRYWNKIVTERDKNSIVYNCYLYNFEVDQSGGNSWVTPIRTLHEKLNLNSLWENHGTIQIKRVVDYIKQQLHHLYEFTWNNELYGHENNKLRFYRKYKKDFKQEDYFSYNSNFAQRCNLTKLRISAHSLAIEKGRYQGLTIEQRTCRSCPTEIEDEKHFLLHCPMYNDIRNDLCSQIESVNPHFNNLNENEKLKLLIDPKEKTYFYAILKFLDKAFELR